jgi:hypothetical protein
MRTTGGGNVLKRNGGSFAMKKWKKKMEELIYGTVTVQAGEFRLHKRS